MQLLLFCTFMVKRVFSPVEDWGDHFNVPHWTQASRHHPSVGFSPEATWMAPHLRHEQGTVIHLQFVLQLRVANWNPLDNIFTKSNTMSCVSCKGTSLNICHCFHSGRWGAGSRSDESVWSSDILHNVSASARGKILHSDLYDNTLHALQLRQHPGGHPNQTG